MNNRPTFPKRAVITAGMPYGNKALHFGHVGGVFVQADILARFLRDRLGQDNVIFVSGTDCYGATIEAGYRAACDEGFVGSLHDYITRNHEDQKQTLERYFVSPNLFAASALGQPGAIHAALSRDIFLRLHERGVLSLHETLQFYDEERGVFLNGRQVTGRCPIQGCKSEIAYADECALGHQYSPAELIAPVSTLSGKTPAQIAVKNWFFDLPRYAETIKEVMVGWQDHPACRSGLLKIINEFLKNPSIYVKKELMDDVRAIDDLPPFEVIEEEQKPSCELVFVDLAARETAAAALTSAGIRYRTGKTLVPFRLSGNVGWGIPVPEKDGAQGLTFWVWPESLWAPISFTKAVLGDGEDGKKWEDWWKSPDAQVYQFIGEDNIYFYGIAEMALFCALDQGFVPPLVVPNHHLLFGKKKASSSGAMRAPMAAELLDHYTPEQLRLHFMNASLAERSVGFEPKAIVGGQGFDSVLNEGNLATNVFNRLVRSCFYTLQKLGDTTLPQGEISPAVKEAADKVILDYELQMSRLAFDRVFELLNVYLREANRDWAARSKTDDESQLRQLLVDAFHAVRVCASLFHPITPEGCERVREYLGVGEDIWSWDSIFRPLNNFLPAGHTFKFLEPRTDFFLRHESQLD